MELIKVKSNKTYKDKKGNEHNYYNYYLVLDNGSRIQIKASFPMKDNAKLDVIAKYVK